MHSAPLLSGTDVSRATAGTIKTLTATEVLAVIGAAPGIHSCTSGAPPPQLEWPDIDAFFNNLESELIVIPDDAAPLGRLAAQLLEASSRRSRLRGKQPLAASRSSPSLTALAVSAAAAPAPPAADGALHPLASPPGPGLLARRAPRARSFQP